MTTVNTKAHALYQDWFTVENDITGEVYGSICKVDGEWYGYSHRTSKIGPYPTIELVRKSLLIRLNIDTAPIGWIA